MKCTVRIYDSNTVEIEDLQGKATNILKCFTIVTVFILLWEVCLQNSMNSLNPQPNFVSTFWGKYQ